MALLFLFGFIFFSSFSKLNNRNKIYVLIFKGRVAERGKAKLPNLVPAAAIIHMSSPLLSVGLIMWVKAADLPENKLV